MIAEPALEHATEEEPHPGSYDVVVLGGALAGASAARLLRQRLPGARILIIESSERFGHKVGEATVEVSGLFFYRVLQEFDHLSRCQLPKHGLRYWFAAGDDASLAEMAEVGPSGTPSVPSFQLDRALFDQHLLDAAVACGVELLRPARAREVEVGWPISTLRIEHAGDTREISARWIVDATGRHGFLARRLRLFRRVEEHPTAACWGRWHGVADFDGPVIAGEAGKPVLVPLAACRRLATNHFCGDGYWIWAIPHSSGKTSVGVVWDKRIFTLPGEGDARARFETFMRSHPGLRELLRGATLDDEDFLSLSHLPYRATQYMDRGWALVGDAAGFMDPYYSPGMDHVAMSVFASVLVIADALAGKLEGAQLEQRVAVHNDAFVLSYGRWLDALYVDKYYLLGDAELTGCAFLIDTASYYLGVVTPVYRDLANLRNPAFGVALPQATIAYHLVRFFNRRLQRIAEKRRRRGTFGRRNSNWRLYVPAFRLGRGAIPPLLRGLRLWLRLELESLWPWPSKARARRGPVGSQPRSSPGVAGL